jgi:hypothetical protein
MVADISSSMPGLDGHVVRLVIELKGWQGETLVIFFFSVHSHSIVESLVIALLYITARLLTILCRLPLTLLIPTASSPLLDSFSWP